MNYITHLNAFFECIAADNRMTPTHISLYMALFRVWNVNRFNNPISISRERMMKGAKIHAKATYHKVIRELDEFGYITYQPSYDPFKGSAIYMASIEPGKGIMLPQNDTGGVLEEDRRISNVEQVPVQKTVLYINPTKTINNKTVNQAGDGVVGLVKGGVLQKNTTRLPGEEKKLEIRQGHLQRPRTVEEVKEYFSSHDGSVVEAQKFFNYFESNGWKVGGRAPMKDWQAAARNWILNAQKFVRGNGTHDNSVHLIKEKNYAEPL